MGRERVVITGCGCWTPAGRGAAAAFEAVAADVPVERFAAPSVFPADLPPHGSRPVAKLSIPAPEAIGGLPRPFPDVFTRMAVVAVDDAIAAGALTSGHVDRTRLGLILTSSFGPFETVVSHLTTLFRDGPARISPMSFSRSVFNAVIGELSRRHKLQGPSTLVTGSTAVGYAYDLIQEGAADAVVCVGVDEVSDLHVYAYGDAGLLDGGMVLGEATAAVVLESERSARARDAVVIAEVAEYGTAFCPESVQHLTRVTAEAIGQAMTQALDRAGLAAAAVDAVVTLASGDADMRAQEETALAGLFGKPVRKVPVKTTLGESFGSAGVLGVVVAAEALRTAAPPATTCVVNACEVGGAVSSAVLRRWEAQ